MDQNNNNAGSLPHINALFQSLPKANWKNCSSEESGNLQSAFKDYQRVCNENNHDSTTNSNASEPDFAITNNDAPLSKVRLAQSAFTPQVQKPQPQPLPQQQNVFSSFTPANAAPHSHITFTHTASLNNNALTNNDVTDSSTQLLPKTTPLLIPSHYYGVPLQSLPNSRKSIFVRGCSHTRE